MLAHINGAGEQRPLHNAAHEAAAGSSLYGEAFANYIAIHVALILLDGDDLNTFLAQRSCRLSVGFRRRDGQN